MQAVLPPDETKMGSIARILSLNDLSRVIGEETGEQVFYVCRGVDFEPVKETQGALTKSITAFKSFPRADIKEAQRWISLLATDISKRVDQDTKRNNRFPKLCTIQYICESSEAQRQGSKIDRITRSFRLQFPKYLDRVAKLTDMIIDALVQRSHFPIFRLGICAGGFETRAKNGGIGLFFSNQVRKESDNNEIHVREKKEGPFDSPPYCSEPVDNLQNCVPSQVVTDLEYAKKLQSTFDREHALVNRRSPKKTKIDSFFSRKKRTGT